MDIEKIDGLLDKIEESTNRLARLTERFVNFLPKDVEDKNAMLDQVGPQIDIAYEYCDGFLSVPVVAESELARNKLVNGTMWKMVRTNGVIVAGIIYGDKIGRKGLCAWTDGTRDGSRGLASIVREDLALGRAWIEISGKAELFYKKHGKGKSHLPKEEAQIVMDALGKSDTIEKWYDDGYYDRKIQGVLHKKCIMGTAEVPEQMAASYKKSGRII